MGLFKDATRETIMTAKILASGAAGIAVTTVVAYNWVFGTFFTNAQAEELKSTIVKQKDVREIQDVLKSLDRSIQYQRLGLLNNTIHDTKKDIKKIKDKDEKEYLREKVKTLTTEKSELEKSLGIAH